MIYGEMSRIISRKIVSPFSEKTLLYESPYTLSSGSYFAQPQNNAEAKTRGKKFLINKNENILGKFNAFSCSWQLLKLDYATSLER
jgi:hypothetical protein